MHITIVDEELPYPPVSGKRIRILNLAVHLAQRHQITFLCHANSNADETRIAEDYLHSKGIHTILVDRQQRGDSGVLAAIRYFARIGMNVFSSVPYSVQWNACPRLREAIARHASDSSVDAWQCEWAPYATALLGTSNTRWIMMAHDIQTLIWERYYRTETNPLKRWYIKRQWQRYRRYEQRVFSSASLTITVTDNDAQRAARSFGARHIAVVDNGVDVAHYQSIDGGTRSPRRSNEILFLGNLEWRANIDAVRLLLNDVFPKVVAAEPSARLRIVGRRPPKWMRQAAERDPNVEVDADVADVRPYLHGCGVMAVPLRIGGGSRLKILEALACGMPVVSTGVGAEGLRLEPGRHYVKADDTAEMADTLVRWIRDPAPALELARAGQTLVQAQYDWSVLAQKMEQAWDRVVQTAEPRALVEAD
jgi:polysaccharide biosynthesis protein PslH